MDVLGDPHPLHVAAFFFAVLPFAALLAMVIGSKLEPMRRHKSRPRTSLKNSKVI